MKTLPTAGPWTFSGQLIVGPPEPHQNPKAQPEGKVVASLAWDFDGDHGATERRTTWAEAEANGRLMIAARAMLDALRDCITDDGAQCIRTCDVAYMIRRFRAINATARAAIELAEGGAT